MGKMKELAIAYEAWQAGENISLNDEMALKKLGVKLRRQFQ